MPIFDTITNNGHVLPRLSQTGPIFNIKLVSLKTTIHGYTSFDEN